MIDRIIIVLALTAAAIAAVGCGDDSSGDSGIETSSLTKAQFIKRADAICSKGSEVFFNKLSAYMLKHESDSKPEGQLAAEGIQKTVLPELESQTDEIEDLGAPAGDERQLEAFLAAQRRSIDSLENRRSLSLATDLDPAFRESGDLARQYGIQACAYG